MKDVRAILLSPTEDPQALIGTSPVPISEILDSIEGYVAHFNVKEDVILWLDEDGYLKPDRYEINVAASRLLSRIALEKNTTLGAPIVGPVILTGPIVDEDVAPLTRASVKWLEAMIN